MRILGKRILAEKIVPQTTNASGLYIPVSEQKKFRAKVLIVGEGVEGINKGDEIQYYQGTGVEINYKGKNCLFLKTAKLQSEVEFVI